MRTLTSSKYLLPIEIDHLLAILEKYREVSERDCLLIELAFKTGARASEIIKPSARGGKEVGTGLRKQDLISTRDYKAVHVRGLKGSLDRDVAISEALYARVERYAATIETEYLFPISYERLVQIWHDLRPVKKSFHSLRHTHAVELWRRHRNILWVKSNLGHKKLETTMIYTTIPIEASEFRKMAL